MSSRSSSASSRLSSPIAGCIIELDAKAKAWLAEKGYEPLYGARPLGRVIQEHIKRPLADELLFGRLAKGGKVLVTIEGDEPSFQFEGAPLGPRRALPKPELKALPEPAG